MDPTKVHAKEVSPGWNRPHEEGVDLTAAPHPQIGGGGGQGGAGEGPVSSMANGQGLDRSCVHGETLMEILEGALLGASELLQAQLCRENVCAPCAPRPAPSQLRPCPGASPRLPCDHAPVVPKLQPQRCSALSISPSGALRVGLFE